MPSDTSSLHPEAEQFASILREMGDILAELGNEFWAAKIHKIEEIARNSHAACAKQFLGYLGGMGSLNDYIWCAGSDRLLELLERGSALAKSLQH